MGIYEDFQEVLTSRFSADDVLAIVNMLRVVAKDYSFQKQETALSIEVGDDSETLVKSFICQKMVEGLSVNSLKNYKGILTRIYQRLKIPLRLVKGENILAYLAERQLIDGLSAVSRDNELRVLRTFYSWAAGNDFVAKNPTVKIKAVKCPKVVKKPFSEMELEQLRSGAETLSNPLKWCAIIETLSSTGCRVSELVGMDRGDIDGDKVIVHGKGNKERYVYLNARALMALSQWLESRNDSCSALFISDKKAQRLSKGRVEQVVRELGNSLGIEKCHPHRFRRTTATLALNRGMPIEQVSKMLGHEKLETTQIYARASEESLAFSHKKYVT